MLSGLFDRHPRVQVILGHLGEGLPALLPRLEHRLNKQKHGVVTTRDGMGCPMWALVPKVPREISPAWPGAHVGTRTLNDLICTPQPVLPGANATARRADCLPLMGPGL
jgi:hypothetical protein